MYKTKTIFPASSDQVVSYLPLVEWVVQMGALELYQENLPPIHTNPPRLRIFLLNIMHKNVLHSLRHDQQCIQAPAKKE